MDARCGGRFGGYCPQLTNQTWDVANACTQKPKVEDHVEGCKNDLVQHSEGYVNTDSVLLQGSRHFREVIRCIDFRVQGDEDYSFSMYFEECLDYVVGIKYRRMNFESIASRHHGPFAVVEQAPYFCTCFIKFRSHP
jgi:hypothetical protein